METLSNDRITITHELCSSVQLSLTTLGFGEPCWIRPTVFLKAISRPRGACRITVYTLCREIRFLPERTSTGIL